MAEIRLPDAAGNERNGPTAGSFILSTSRKRHLTLLLLITTAICGISFIPRPSINTFTYHSWRQTQTYAAYRCISDGAFWHQVRCFFSQPIGVDNHYYFGLEAPLFQLFESIFCPHHGPTALTNIGPFFGVFATFFVLTSLCLLRFHSILGWVFGTAIGATFLKSPIVIFFEHSFMPNFFAFSIFLAGALMTRNMVRREYGLLVAGLAIAACPQLSIMAAGLPLWLAALRRRNLATNAKQLPNVPTQLISDALILYAPLAVYEATSYALLLAGYSLPYPHWTRGVTTNLRDPHFFGVLSDQIAFAGAGLIVAMVSTILASWSRLGWRNRAFILVSAYPIVAYLITFVLLFTLFADNTYYAFYLIAAFTLSFIVSIESMRSLEVADKKQFACGALFASCATVAVLIPVTSITPSGREWYGAYLYNAMAQLSPTCDARNARKLTAGVRNDAILFLDCASFDPTCRTATNYKGSNLPYGEALISSKLQQMRQEGAFYLSCPGYSGLAKNSDARRQLSETAERIISTPDWVLYAF